MAIGPKLPRPSSTLPRVTRICTATIQSVAAGSTDVATSGTSHGRKSSGASFSPSEPERRRPAGQGRLRETFRNQQLQAQEPCSSPWRVFSMWPIHSMSMRRVILPRNLYLLDIVQSRRVVARKHNVWVARMRARSAMRKAVGRSSASEAASGDTTVVVRLGARVPCLPDAQNGP